MHALVYKQASFHCLEIDIFKRDPSIHRAIYSTKFVFIRVLHFTIPGYTFKFIHILFAQQYLQWLYTNQQNKNMYKEPTLVRDYFISQIFCTLFPWFVASFFHPWWNLIFFSLILQLIAPLVASVPLVLSDLSEPKDKQCEVLKLLKLKMKKFHTNIQIVWYCK